jgi:hypothetical protein
MASSTLPACSASVARRLKAPHRPRVRPRSSPSLMYWTSSARPAGSPSSMSAAARNSVASATRSRSWARPAASAMAAMIGSRASALPCSQATSCAARSATASAAGVGCLGQLDGLTGGCADLRIERSTCAVAVHTGQGREHGGTQAIVARSSSATRPRVEVPPRSSVAASASISTRPDRSSGSNRSALS